MSLGEVLQALSPLQMEAGEKKMAPDWDPQAMYEDILEGARVDVGRQGSVCGSEMLHSPSTRDWTNNKRTEPQDP